MDALLNLPSSCWSIIFQLLKSKWKLVLRDIASCRSTSKAFQRLFSDEYLIKILPNNPSSGLLKEKYLHAKIQQIIRCRSINALQLYLDLVAEKESIDTAYGLMNQYLLYILKRTGSSFFLAVLTGLEINGNKPVFAATDLNVLIRAIECLCEKSECDDSDIEVMTMLLTCLGSKFRHADARHVKQIRGALKNKQKLNTNNDIFYRIKQATRRSDSSTRILLELLRPIEKKFVVPEGQLIHVAPRLFKSHRKLVCAMSVVESTDESKCVLQYYDHKHKQHEITLLRERINEYEYSDREYVYGNHRSNNLYEMIVSTQIGEEVFRSFPYQLVAVTEEALNLPLEEQPWFWGNLKDEEIRQIIDYDTALRFGSSFFITVSRGSRIYLRRGRGYMPFPTAYNPQSLKNQMPGLFAGIYNKGSIDTHIYKFYRLVAKGDLCMIEKYHKEHNIDLSQLIEPNILGDYLQAVQRPDEKVIDWLIENGCAGVDKLPDNYVTLIGKVLQKCKLSVAHTLLDRGAECTAFNISILLFKYPISHSRFIQYWNRMKENVSQKSEEMFGSLLSNIHNYTAERPTNKTLIMCAWKFGNNDNYFKKLPKEIMIEIIKYGLDDPEWHQIADCIVDRSTRLIYSLGCDSQTVNLRQRLTDNFILYAPYIVKNHLKFDAEFYKSLLFCLAVTNHKNDQLTAHWMSKITLLMPNVALNCHNAEDLLNYCLKNERGLPIMKVLIESGFMTRNFLRNFTHRHTTARDGVITIPLTWLAALSKNETAVKYLCGIDVVPMSYERLTLQQFLINEKVNDEVYELVLHCTRKE